LESFNHTEIERDVGPIPELYAGLSEEALYTSEEDLLSIFQHPLISGTWVDLGAGVGKSVLLYAARFPERKSVGIECAKARVEAGLLKIRERELSNAELLLGDLLFTEIPEGDVYFLYFPTGPVLDRLLCELSQKPKRFKIVAIESHGDLLLRLSKENWLTLKDEIHLSSQRHYPQAQIFESNGLFRETELSFYDLSFQHKYLLISEGEKSWIGESFGMTEIREDEFNLLVPPRTIQRDSVMAILDESEILEGIFPALKLRRELAHPLIRKIFVTPGFSLEISTGETIEWNQFLELIQENKCIV
jgi:hypothetical protein